LSTATKTDEATYTNNKFPVGLILGKFTVPQMQHKTREIYIMDIVSVKKHTHKMNILY